MDSNSNEVSEESENWSIQPALLEGDIQNVCASVFDLLRARTQTSVWKGKEVNSTVSYY